jgi:hypothetical protein
MCPHKHQLAYRERWEPEKEAPALSKGRLFHDVLAAHYLATRDGLSPSSGVTNVLVGCPDEELTELVSWMYVGYLDAYGLDPDWEILEVESTREIWLPTERGGRSGFRLKVKIDLLIRDEVGRTWLVDHKTAGDFASELGLDLDDQFSLYQWALERCGVPVHGVIYNCARTRRNKTPMTLEQRFRRVMLYRTPEQLQNTAIDAWRTARRMSKACERTTNSDRCTWGCSFTEPCLHGRKGGDEHDFLLSSGYRQWTNGNGNDRAGESEES